MNTTSVVIGISSKGGLKLAETHSGQKWPHVQIGQVTLVINDYEAGLYLAALIVRAAGICEDAKKVVDAEKSV